MPRLDLCAPGLRRCASAVLPERPPDAAAPQAVLHLRLGTMMTDPGPRLVLAKTADDVKLARILAKTWMKMSEQGHAQVGKLDLPARVVTLLHRGLAEMGDGAKS
jgi:hypothetical protein